MNENAGVFLGFLFGGGVLLATFVIAFVVFRAIVLWYWRVNEVVEILERIDRKLGVIADDVPKRGKFQFSFLESIDKKLDRLVEVKPDASPPT